MPSRDLPVGTVSFVFTDIEGSTRLLQDLGETYRPVLERHNDLVLGAVTENQGSMVKNEGDGFFLSFQSAVDAVACAVKIQRALAAEPWPTLKPVRVRIGIHTGEGRLGGSDYVGIDVHRAARIGESGHGGQILLSETTTRLTEYALPPGTRIENLGNHRLRDLTHEEHLYQLTIDGLQAEFAPLRTMTSAGGNLPRRDLQLIGRIDEQRVVGAALQNNRLVTITGPAGVGKTSLALKVAADLYESFADGVWFVEVSRVADESVLAPSVARLLHITESPHQPLIETLASRLGRARALLVLDGCEHLIDPVAKLTDFLLERTSELKILATSRELLSIRHEHLVHIGPLPIPGAGAHSVGAIAEFDSVALFLDRARLVAPGFELDEKNASFVAEVCRRLDGIPLAIELAAARLKVLSVGQLVQRLDQQFALLSGTLRDMPPHQQTLETTLDWSYDFLSGAERLLFKRLSIFSGGFTLEAAEQVCSGDLVGEERVLNLLARLVETSLVMATGTDDQRYRLLEPISHYARMRLEADGRNDDLRDRHARFYIALAEEADLELLGREQTTAADRLEQEHYNLRNALEWLFKSGDFEGAVALSGALRWFWVIKRDVSEGTEWIERTLSKREGLPPEVVARALSGAGLLAIRRLDFPRAKSALGEGLDLYRQLGDGRGEARQTYLLGVLAWFEDDLEEADRLISQAESVSRANGEDWALAWSLAVKGTMARLRGDLDQARRHMTESHQIFLDRMGTLDIGWSLLRMGAVARDEGRYFEAEERYTAGRSLLFKAGETLGLAHADAGLGAMAWLAGDHEHALDLYRSVLEGFSLSEEASNNLFELKTMIQGNPSTTELQEIVESNRNRAVRIEGQAGARAALAEYLYHVGKTAYRNEQIERSRGALAESLQLSDAAGDKRGVAVAVAGLAVCAHALDENESAARLFGLADWVASDAQVRIWPPPDEPDYAHQVAAVREALGAG
ncbi:MAG TPA: adenylate/guanylate cyclase domain-containing protein, partial [Acidimicrobiia bacterium]